MRRRTGLGSRPILLLAFAFAVMADPVSSVAYAVEAALRALDGDLTLLVPTMGLVVGIVAIVIINYRQLIARYPGGGGAAGAVGEAFGDAWSFLPIGALIVDFVLTIAISVSAGASAVIAYFPELAPMRLALALGLVLVVGGITLFGHLGRVVFAVMTLSFILVAVIVLAYSLGADPQPPVDVVATAPGGASIFAVLLAFPVAMALATGVEAPSSAIAQLGQLDGDGRRRFGQLTLWLTLGVVGTITIGLSVAIYRLQIALPSADSTLVAELARMAAPAPVFAAFQLVTALLLLAAASSSFQAGPGLLAALAVRSIGKGHDIGILPRAFGRTNRARTPYWGVALFAALAMVIVVIGGGRDQVLVLYYAVAVFISFLAGLVAMATFSKQDGRLGYFVLNVFGAVVVGFTLVANLTRGYPLVSLVATLLIASGLFWMWVRAGRPRGVRNVAAEAELEAAELASDEPAGPADPVDPAVASP